MPPAANFDLEPNGRRHSVPTGSIYNVITVAAVAAESGIGEVCGGISSTSLALLPPEIQVHQRARSKIGDRAEGPAAAGRLFFVEQLHDGQNRYMVPTSLLNTLTIPRFPRQSQFTLLHSPSQLIEMSCALGEIDSIER